MDAPITDIEQDVNYGQVTFSAWCRLPEGSNLGELIIVLKVNLNLFLYVCDVVVYVFYVCDQLKFFLIIIYFNYSRVFMNVF